MSGPWGGGSREGHGVGGAQRSAGEGERVRGVVLRRLHWGYLMWVVCMMGYWCCRMELAAEAVSVLGGWWSERARRGGVGGRILRVCMSAGKQ